MKKILTLILMILISGSFLIAGNDGDKSKNQKSEFPVSTYEINGNVTDMNSGESLAGAMIEVEGTDIILYTDFDGFFIIPNLKPGKYNVIVSFISYKKSYIENITVGNDDGELNIKLVNAIYY